MRAMTGFDELREHNRITWIEQAQGWIAAPDDIVNVLANEGFEECKRETTTSRRDRQPAGGLWQGVNTLTGSVASAIWVTRPVWQDAVVFIEVDGESLAGGLGRPSQAMEAPRAEGVAETAGRARGLLGGPWG